MFLTLSISMYVEYILLYYTTCKIAVKYHHGCNRKYTKWDSNILTCIT